ncbi:MAG TPA: hypothetical protein VIO16_06005 [Dehalococcoidia bacterium]
MMTVRADLLAAASATGDGPVYDNGVPFFAAALQLEFTGAPAQVVVNLYGLIHGTTWALLAVLDTAQGYLAGEVASLQVPVLVRQVKCNLGTLSGGTNPTVTAHFTGNM